jgi:hypothetical protein
MAVSSFNIQDTYQQTARTKFRSEITIINLRGRQKFLENGGLGGPENKRL